MIAAASSSLLFVKVGDLLLHVARGELLLHGLARCHLEDGLACNLLLALSRRWDCSLQAARLLLHGAVLGFVEKIACYDLFPL
jgi:hypothetical protein